MVLDAESKMFMVYIAALEAPEMTIHPSQTAQITGGGPMQITTSKQDEALTKVPTKYSDFSDVFSEKKVLILPKKTEFN